MTNAQSLIGMTVLCSVGDSTQLTGNTVFANNYIFTDPVKTQPIYYYILLAGPNNVTVTGNHFSMHLLCAEFGTTMAVGIQTLCLP